MVCWTCRIEHFFDLLADSEIDYINNVRNITFTTENIDAWSYYFEDLLSESVLDYTIELDEDNNEIKITFNNTNESDFPDLTLIIIEIEVQISPGLIK